MVLDPLAETRDVHQYLATNAPDVRIKAVSPRVEDVPTDCGLAESVMVTGGESFGCSPFGRDYFFHCNTL